EQLTGHVRLARGAVGAEPPPVRLGVIRERALAQVPEDLARPAEQSPVLDLKDGDLIRSGDGFQLGAVLRPRLDLACDEVEPELCQNLSDRRRERAPLRLIQG